jgi:hypothetical protein
MEQLLKALKEGTCFVSYQKVDTGEVRDMECTLKPELIPNHPDVNQNADSDQILVWALDRNDWRSFFSDTLKDWKVK